LRFSQIAVICGLILLCATVFESADFTDVKPSPQQVAWQDLEIGAIIHFGPNTFMAREWGDGTADPSVFNPSAADPEQLGCELPKFRRNQICRVRRQNIMTAFVLWPTEQSQ